MSPDRLGRDDVAHALDALASEVRAPSANAASLVARGRRRVRQRRVRLVAGSTFVLVAVIVSVTLVTRPGHTRAVSTTPNASTTTTTTPTSTKPTAATPPPERLAFVSASEGWICGDQLMYTIADFNEAGLGTKSVHIPAGKTTRGTQPTLCAAAPGGNAWLLRPSGDPDRPEIVRIRSAGADVKVFPFARIPGAVVVSLDFVDADNGWALADRSSGPSDLYRTADGGATWTALLRGTAPLSDQLDFGNTATGWASGYALPNLATTNDGGRTWQPVRAPTPNGATQFAPLVPALVSGNTVVAYGAWDTDAGVRNLPFIDVSTDGGTTWSVRSGPAGVSVPGSAATGIFSAFDADHWALASGNRLYLTDDGGRTWALHAQFAGMGRIVYVARQSATAIFVSGVSDLSNHSTLVLGTAGEDDNWSIVDFWAPPLAPNAAVIGWPGGIIGCPTRPLTPVPPGNPPAGLESAALAYVHRVRHYDGTVSEVYRVGTRIKETYASIFAFHVGSCGQDVVDTSWVVELFGPAGSGGGGSTPQAQIVFAHYADGWHAFGSYH